MVPIIPEAIERYCTSHSTPASAVADALERHTVEHCEYPQMLVGAWEGAFLRLLVGATGARRILEIGLFTGYSALSMAEGLPDNGEIISCDINPKTAATAQQYFDRSAHGHKITIRVGAALATLKTLTPPFDLVFIDADKENYSAYFEATLPLLRHGGLIVADNVLWSGRVLQPQEETDRAIVTFNDKIKNDPRVECVMLPIRDGVTLIKKR